MDEAITTTEPIDLPLPITIELETLPLSEMPEEAQQILTLSACGFSVRSIASLSKTTPARIRGVLERFDPQRKFALSSADRAKFLSRLWEARAAEALLHLTPEKLEKSNAVQLATIARNASDQSRKNSVKAVKKQDFQDLLSSLGGSSSSPDHPQLPARQTHS